MKDKKTLSPDFIAKAEKIINDKFQKDYPRSKRGKYSLIGVPLNVCMLIGCLFISLVAFR